ncbi:MAG: aldehyde dehydrogenase family protein [Anaerolineaceae bacterium]|jgi:1-pyrroline-5-carboxylate dehydrogenase|nr:aldehyde dehydrogenase family protein [Anaerolineaceae bacterium]
MTAESSFKLTYATMFNPPEELHTRFNDALVKVKAEMGQEYPLLIGGEERFCKEKFDDRTPMDAEQVLGVFQKGTAKDGQDALAAARAAFPAWSRMKWQERVALVRKAADLIDERLFAMSAAMTFEVGKNRMESLGDVAEAAELMRHACQMMEEHDGFVTPMLPDPLPGFVSRNTSVMRPYGVWLVISPFNFPAALTGGPVGAALVAGNTVVIKPSSDTPLLPYLFTRCLLDAGFPDGVVNFVTGPGSTLGQALIDSPEVDGVTFTGSYPVGMGIYRSFAAYTYVRPLIMELGGKNCAIVSRNADIETAALGIVRSAFGLQGQKCSACSRVLVEAPVYDALVERVVALTEKLSIGDPTDRSVYLGPVINKKSWQEYQDFVEELRKDGTILTGGKVWTEGELSKGYFCAPTLAADLPFEHRLWKQEMFLPITTIGKVESLDEAMQIANSVDYGLTAGFYGTPEEAEWFFENIEVGVSYVNRPQGASTGAWPGFQPFGGWKASGATGKNAGGPYYLAMYMREQSRTVIAKA